MAQLPFESGTSYKHFCLGYQLKPEEIPQLLLKRDLYS
jgi:hypothetical protein